MKTFASGRMAAVRTPARAFSEGGKMFDSRLATAGVLAATLAGTALSVPASASARECRGIIACGETGQASGRDATGRLPRDLAEAIAAAGDESRWQGAREPEVAQAGPERRTRRFAAAGPKCTGMPESSACWKGIANRPGCFVLDPYLLHDQTVDWSGGCAGGAAHGHGTASWHGPDGSGEATGEYVHGMETGPWVERWSDGLAAEGAYVDGERDGLWTMSWADGDRFKGNFRNGRPNGPGIYTTADGEAFRGWFRDGCLRHRSGLEIAVSTDHEACGFE